MINMTIYNNTNNQKPLLHNGNIPHCQLPICFKWKIILADLKIHPQVTNMAKDFFAVKELMCKLGAIEWREVVYLQRSAIATSIIWSLLPNSIVPLEKQNLMMCMYINKDAYHKCKNPVYSLFSHKIPKAASVVKSYDKRLYCGMLQPLTLIKTVTFMFVFNIFCYGFLNVQFVLLIEIITDRMLFWHVLKFNLLYYYSLLTNFICSIFWIVNGQLIIWHFIYRTTNPESLGITQVFVTLLYVF